MKQNLAKQLEQFTGAEKLIKFNSLVPYAMLTDGTKFLATEAEAYWLMDAIASYQPKLLKAHWTFQVWELQLAGSRGVLTCTDGNDTPLVRQKIEYTDFPLEYIKLYACYDGERVVIMLPNEY